MEDTEAAVASSQAHQGKWRSPYRRTMWRSRKPAHGSATFAIGMDIWPAFLGSVAEARSYLDHGAYHLDRMVSVYAAMRSIGISADLSFAIQIAVSLGAVAAAVTLSLKPIPRRQVLGIALGLLLPDLAARASALEEALVLALAWGASFGGFGIQRVHQYIPAEGDKAPSLARSSCSCCSRSCGAF